MCNSPRLKILLSTRFTDYQGHISGIEVSSAWSRRSRFCGDLFSPQRDLLSINGSATVSRTRVAGHGYPLRLAA